MTAIRSGIKEPKPSNIKAFNTITDFDTKALTLRLGYLTSTISEQILREIEREIKTINEERRSVNVNETSRTQLSGSTRDLSSSDSSIEGEKLRQETTREVRADGDELPERGTHQWYNYLVTEGTLLPMMHQVNEEAWERMEKLKDQMLQEEPLQNPTNTYQTYRHREMIRTRAEEIILQEIIFKER